MMDKLGSLDEVSGSRFRLEYYYYVQVAETVDEALEKIGDLNMVPVKILMRQGEHDQFKQLLPVPKADWVIKHYRGIPVQVVPWKEGAAVIAIKREDLEEFGLPSK